MIRLNAIQRSILVEGPDDAVGLWQVARETREILGLQGADAVREAALEILEPLLERGYILVGDLAADGTFAPWSRQGRDALLRIGIDWRQLGRDPNIGEVCWLFNTALGNSVAKRLRTS